MKNAKWRDLPIDTDGKITLGNLIDKGRCWLWRDSGDLGENYRLSIVEDLSQPVLLPVGPRHTVLQLLPHLSCDRTNDQTLVFSASHDPPTDCLTDNGFAAILIHCLRSFPSVGFRVLFPVRPHYSALAIEGLPLWVQSSLPLPLASNYTILPFSRGKHHGSRMLRGPRTDERPVEIRNLIDLVQWIVLHPVSSRAMSLQKIVDHMIHLLERGDRCIRNSDMAAYIAYDLDREKAAVRALVQQEEEKAAEPAAGSSKREMGRKGGEGAKKARTKKADAEKKGTKKTGTKKTGTKKTGTKKTGTKKRGTKKRGTKNPATKSGRSSMPP